MLFDAIVLTGGRSSRLDSIPKSEFMVDESTLLERTLRAASDARRIVVVGHEPATALPVDVTLVREEPPFSGPVSAIAAGVSALLASTVAGENAGGKDHGFKVDEAILVLACDMPHIGLAVPFLLRALTENPDTDGALAVDAENRRQPLAAVYRSHAVLTALDAAGGAFVASEPGDPLAGLPMFRLLDHMALIAVSVPGDSTADVDTWDDAVRLGAHPPHEQTPTTRERYAR
ncbi:MAG: NTP transferase domain-containing protein [Microbacteriaceae bacterium]|nr:NTP transferase domain-containing protein [Microbacteriaceae bacterium]